MMANFISKIKLDDKVYQIKGLPKYNLVNQSAPSQISLVDNTEYRLTEVSQLDLIFPSENFEVWLNISFSESGIIELGFPLDASFIGAAPSPSNGQIWEISIKDKVIIAWRVK